MGKENTLGITVKKSEDFSEWYTQVIQKSEMMDYSKVSGCMVMRPNSQEVWDEIRDFLDDELKKRGVRNASFPLFIPENLLKKETDHVEGFSPEVAWVTQTGDTELSERLAVRPTSETIMYDSYKDWIRSHNDLPLKLNQWGNVVRWEFNHPVPFIRTREFYWQEGHTAFATEEEADEEVLDIIKLYAQVYEELLAVPMLVGKKSDTEKFAGANYTLSIETLLPNGKAAQAATSHALGQNFSKAFEISFQDEEEQVRNVWQNSWGFSTRSIGVMVMTHGDDKGVVMPPRIAPVQAVIIPIIFSEKPDLNEKVLESCEDIKNELEGTRTELDDRDNYSPGWKFNDWEMKGVPLRIEIGPKDVEKGQAVLVRRDTGEKSFVKVKDIKEEVESLLKKIQGDLLKKAKLFLKNNTVEAKNFDDLKKAVSNGKIVLADWCDSPGCEKDIKDKTGGAKTLNKPFGSKPTGNCISCGTEAKTRIYFGKSY